MDKTLIFKIPNTLMALLCEDSGFESIAVHSRRDIFSYFETVLYLYRLPQ